MPGRKNRSRTRRIYQPPFEQASLAKTPSGGAIPENVLDVLARGEIITCDELPWGSNYSFAVALTLSENDEPPVLGIYKPRRGEVPLWDFPDGTLYQREYASYLLSQFLGWEFIPHTVIREGPYGIGSVQLYVEPDETVDFDRMRDDNRADLQRIAAFDLIANNADRKLSHLLRDHHGKVWGIDHGLTFNVAPKLRTVIWDFCGEALPDDVRADLESVARNRARADALRALLSPHLASEEVDLTLRRLERVATLGVFPRLDPYRNYPRGFW